MIVQILLVLFTIIVSKFSWKRLNQISSCVILDSCFTSIGCICSHSKHCSIGRGHQKQIVRSETVNRWKCLRQESSFIHRAMWFSAPAISSATKGTSAMPSSNLSMCVPCRTYQCSCLRSTPTVIMCTVDHRMVSPTPTCARCCSNCDAKAKICAAIVDFCPIQSIKHSAFWHRFNYSKRRHVLDIIEYTLYISQQLTYRFTNLAIQYILYKIEGNTAENIATDEWTAEMP